MSDDNGPDPVRLHTDARARLDAIVAEWERFECPLLSQGSMGQMIEHPLVKMIREHEALVSNLAEKVRKRHSGPQPSAVLGASLGKSGSARLRLARAAKAESA